MFTLKNLLILIGRNLLITLAIFFVTIISIIFLSKEMSRMSDSVALNHKLEAELKNRTELLNVLGHDTQIVGTNDTLIENAFVPSDNIINFVNTLDNLAQTQSIPQTYHFGTPSPATISASFPISSIEYTNNLTTNVQSLLAYLKKFNELPYFTKINGITIASQDKSGWMGPSTITLQATLYTKSTQ